MCRGRFLCKARTGEGIAAWVETYLAAHPGAIEAEEVEHQRAYKWRPFYRWSALMRTPAGGTWGTKAPEAFLAAPRPAKAPRTNSPAALLPCL